MDFVLFRCWNFFLSDRRKISRKRFIDDKEINAIFPPEGFVAVPFDFEPEDQAGKCSRKAARPPHGHAVSNINSSRDTVGESKDVRSVLVVGGARHSEPNTWNFGNLIFCLSFEVTEDDVDLVSSTEIKTTGGIMSPLTNATAIQFCTSEVLLWGSLNLQTYSTTDELVKLSISMCRKKLTCDITIYKTKNALSVIEEEYPFLQTGDVPAARCGHTFTKITNQYGILFGGLELPDRFSADSSAMFKQIPSQGYFYLFNYVSMSWIKLNDFQLEPRAYHTLTLDNNLNILVLTGGIKFENAEAVWLFGIKETVFIEIQFNERNNITLIPYCLPLEITSDLFLSGHGAITLKDNNLLIFGGNQSDHPLIKDISSLPEAGPRAAVINISTGKITQFQANKNFATSGLKMVELDSDSVCVIGGSLKIITIFTRKKMGADKCDYHESCKILLSNEMYPIAFIKCDKCHRWFHQFCVQLRVVPKSNEKFFLP